MSGIYQNSTGRESVFPAEVFSPLRFAVLAVAAALAPYALAQTEAEPPPPPAPRVQTVRESEFRSRWTNPAVDRAPVQETVQTQEDEAEGGLLIPLRRSLNELLRTGPLQLRGSLSAGWESTKIKDDPSRNGNDSSSGGSFVAAPAALLTYIREIGAVDLSLAYSAGYLYFSDSTGSSATGVTENAFNQSFRFDSAVTGLRTGLRNSLSALSGSGQDIETGAQTERLTFGDNLAVSYQLTEFTQFVATGSALYQKRTSEVFQDEESLRLATALNANYFWTGKTTLHLEVGAGQDTRSAQTIGAPDDDASYVQMLAGVKYQPAGKLTFDLGLGVTNRSGSLTQRQGKDRSGVQPAFRLNVDWVLTEKTAASLYLGYEGAYATPQFNLAVRWEPRLTNSVTLSLYQRAGISEFDTGNDEVYRGGLVSVRQRLFSRIELSLSGGLEYTDLTETAATGAGLSNDPFAFAAVSASWSLREWAALELFYRTSSGGSGTRAAETRTGVRLNLTF